MQSFLSLDHLKHRYVLALVMGLFTMVFPTALIAQELNSGGPDRPALPGEVSPLPHEEIGDSPWPPVLSMSIDDLDEYVESQDYLIDYLFNRNWDENAPHAIVVLWPDGNPETDTIVFWPTSEPGIMDVELARYEGTDGDPPYEEYVVVGQGTFVESARFEYQSFTPQDNGDTAIDAEVIAGLLTPDGGVGRSLWGIEHSFTFVDEESGEEGVVSTFMPMHIVGNVDQAVPDAYRFSRIVVGQQDTGKPPSDMLGACPTLVLSMYLPGESDGKGDHPCFGMVKGRVMIAEGTLVACLLACTLTVGGFGYKACSLCLIGGVWGLACAAGCVAVVVAVHQACCWGCDRIYRGQMLLIANDVRLCCTEAGDCPANVPLP